MAAAPPPLPPGADPDRRAAPRGDRLTRRKGPFHFWTELLSSHCSFEEPRVRGGRGGGSAAHSLCGPPVLRVSPAAGVQGGWALPAHAEMHDPSSVPHADLRSEPCRR
ncbi:hypothetical protein Nmel_005728 [Mimus melanotis]